MYREKDGSNPMWEKVKTIWPPNDYDVSVVPSVFRIDNATFDCETGTVFVIKPSGANMEPVILHIADNDL